MHIGFYTVYHFRTPYTPQLFPKTAWSTIFCFCYIITVRALFAKIVALFANNSLNGRVAIADGTDKQIGGSKRLPGT